MDIRFVKRDVLKEKPDQKHLGFGKYMTDYMFVMDWTKEDGWKDARIVPEGPISLEPACVTLHYAQETFEGMKAYRTAEGKIQLFRPEMNAKRMINSNARLCMPEFPVDMFVEAVKALVKVEADWVPSEPETSLYIRPFMFATEAALGVHMASAYKFMIICCPVGAYYAEGINPVKILVEDELVRAVKGGTGFTKCGGNYAGSILGQVKAEKLGYSQVLWLDGEHRKYVEEVGTMNIMFKIAGEIYTAPIEGTVLPGVTRDSMIHLLRDWGYKVNETRLSVDDPTTAFRTFCCLLPSPFILSGISVRKTGSWSHSESASSPGTFFPIRRQMRWILPSLSRSPACCATRRVCFIAP